MKTIILGIMLAFTSTFCFAQNADSVKYYELEPTELTYKVGTVDYQILNYFSKKAKLTMSGRTPLNICCAPPRVSNYGVELRIPQNRNAIFVNNIIFEATARDTGNIPFAKYYIKVQDKNGVISSFPIKVKHYSWVDYKEQRLQVHNSDSIIVTPNKLVEISFDLQENLIEQDDRVFIFREDEHPYSIQSSLMWTKSRKQDTYYIKDGTFFPLQFSIVDDKMKHVAWQVRVQYRAYNKVVD